MYKFLIVLAVLLVICVSMGSWVMNTYNYLIKENENVTGSWAQVETQYQRRFDLIPNLVNATKGYLKQEQAVFGAIADARTHYAGAPAGSNDKVQATNQLEGALSRLMVIMENYPQLKSDATVQRLTDELAGTENRVTIARDRYNTQVLTYNKALIGFPTNVLASMFGFDKRDFFESTKEAADAPVVNLDTD